MTQSDQFAKTRSEKFFRVAELLAICATCFGVVSWMMEADNRRQERNARSWSIVTAQSSGNSGKIEALENLAGQDIPLDGIDLSCKRMSGDWHDGEKTCERQTYLEDIDLMGASLDSVNLSGSYLVNANLSGTKLNYARLEGASLYGANFAKAEISAASFEGAFIAGADFTGAVGIADADFKDVWAFEAALPKGLSGIEVVVCPSIAWALDESKPAENCDAVVMP